MVAKQFLYFLHELFKAPLHLIETQVYSLLLRRRPPDVSEYHGFGHCLVRMSIGRISFQCVSCLHVLG